MFILTLLNQNFLEVGIRACILILVSTPRFIFAIKLQKSHFNPPAAYKSCIVRAVTIVVYGIIGVGIIIIRMAQDKFGSAVVSLFSVIVTCILDWYFYKVLYSYYKQPEHQIRHFIIAPNQRHFVNGNPQIPNLQYPPQNVNYRPGDIPPPPPQPPMILEGLPVDHNEPQQPNFHIYGVNQVNTQNIPLEGTSDHQNFNIIAGQQNLKNQVGVSEVT
mmetsp:Transcript_21221/g.23627  ORF Transcript_21221/g.23627 Transcript_21221/m.23627 type:complete len:217 (+) Transcript_21221:75-725(+)